MAITQQALREEVYELILEDILAGSFKSGERISIDGLARKFDISPTPVREALVFLEHSGLVKYAPRKGYVLAPLLTEEQINQLIDARHIVEEAALSRSFSNWEDFSSRLQKVHQEHKLLVEEIRKSDSITYDLVRNHFKIDWSFHQAFFDFADNKYLLDIVESLGTHTYRMRQTWNSPNHSVDAEDALKEHEIILNHILNRNHDAAIKALSDHLENVRKRSKDK